MHLHLYKRLSFLLFLWATCLLGGCGSSAKQADPKPAPVLSGKLEGSWNLDEIYLEEYLYGGAPDGTVLLPVGEFEPRETHIDVTHMQTIRFKDTGPEPEPSKGYTRTGTRIHFDDTPVEYDYTILELSDTRLRWVYRRVKDSRGNYDVVEHRFSRM